MKRAIGAFTRRYGASPLHLTGLLASFAVTALAVAGWLEEPASSIKYILIWFLGAILAHDLLLLPLYSALDRAACRAGGPPSPRGDCALAPTRTSAWVFVRVPLLLSGFLLLVFFPEILRLGERTFHLASGKHQGVYLARFLVLVAVMFALSGVAYLRSSARASSRIP